VKQIFLRHVHGLSSYVFFLVLADSIYAILNRVKRNRVERNIPRELECMRNTVSYLNISAINLKSLNSEKDHYKRFLVKYTDN